MRVAFTGHRPEQLHIGHNELSEEGQALRDFIRNEIRVLEQAGADTFFCGAARGADIICGELVMQEKQAHPELKLICVIPFAEQARGWAMNWAFRYRELLRNADQIVLMCSNYQRGCYHMRNRYMVDNCDLLIAIYNGENKGGTAYTINYAREWGKEILIIDPNTLEKTVIPAAYRKKYTKSAAVWLRISLPGR